MSLCQHCPQNRSFIYSNYAKEFQARTNIIETFHRLKVNFKSTISYLNLIGYMDLLSSLLNFQRLALLWITSWVAFNAALAHFWSLCWQTPNQNYSTRYVQGTGQICSFFFAPKRTGPNLPLCARTLCNILSIKLLKETICYLDFSQITFKISIFGYYDERRRNWRCVWWEPIRALSLCSVV